MKDGYEGGRFNKMAHDPEADMPLPDEVPITPGEDLAQAIQHVTRHEEGAGDRPEKIDREAELGKLRSTVEEIRVISIKGRLGIRQKPPENT